MNNYIEKIYYNDEKRPMLLIVPGGGYEYTAESESIPVAYEFLKTGFHQGILYYREDKLKFPEILKNSYDLIKELKEDPLISGIHVIGFSAGGHLAGLLLTEYPKLFKSGVLCYPVISTKIDAIEENSFKNLLVNYPKDLELVSIENRVNKDTPPIFTWHTLEDGYVPHTNSLYLIESLEKFGVKNKINLYEKGHHGLSLVFDDVNIDNQYDEVKTWINDAKKWLLENN